MCSARVPAELATPGGNAQIDGSSGYTSSSRRTALTSRTSTRARYSGVIPAPGQGCNPKLRSCGPTSRTLQSRHGGAVHDLPAGLERGAALRRAVPALADLPARPDLL